jgi:hypothetical protein
MRWDYPTGRSLRSLNTPMIAVTLRARRPTQIQTLDPTTSSSITSGGPSAALFSALSAAGNAGLDGLAQTTGRRLRFSLSTAL